MRLAHIFQAAIMCLGLSILVKDVFADEYANHCLDSTGSIGECSSCCARLQGEWKELAVAHGRSGEDARTDAIEWASSCHLSCQTKYSTPKQAGGGPRRTSTSTADLFASEGEGGEAPGDTGAVVLADILVANTNSIEGGVWKEEFDIACTERREKADTCCMKDPGSCLAEAAGANDGAAKFGVQALYLISQGSMGMSGSISQLCSRMKTVSNGAALINGAMAVTCTNLVRKCKSTCGDLKEKIESEKEALLNRAGDDAELVAKVNNNNQAYNKLLKKIENEIKYCSNADQGAVNAGIQAYASAEAARMSDMCKKQASINLNDGVSNIGENEFNVNCSTPGAASNPVCQQQCQRPGAENDPICRQILQQMGMLGQGAASFGNSANAEGDNQGFDIGPIFEEEQELNIDPVAPEGSSLATASPGGGGGLSPGGGGGSGGGSSGPAVGAGGGAGINGKSILRGTASGNGYTRSAMRSGSGGGYSGPKGGLGTAKKQTKKFSLKDFLPGGKANPKRGLAGIGTGNPEIGSKTDDLFQRISARFYQICLQDRLYDCSTITKRKKSR